jgi:hypothetical protein
MNCFLTILITWIQYQFSDGENKKFHRLSVLDIFRFIFHNLMLQNAICSEEEREKQQ